MDGCLQEIVQLLCFSMIEHQLIEIYWCFVFKMVRPQRKKRVPSCIGPIKYFTDKKEGTVRFKGSLYCKYGSY